MKKKFKGKNFAPMTSRIGRGAILVYVNKDKDRNYYYSPAQWVPLDGRVTLKKAVNFASFWTGEQSPKYEGFMIFDAERNLLYGNPEQIEDFRIIDFNGAMRVISYLQHNVLVPARSIDGMFPYREIAPLMNTSVTMGEDNYIKPFYEGKENAEDIVNKTIIQYNADVTVNEAIKHFVAHFKPERRMLAFKVYVGRNTSFFTSDRQIAPLY